MEGIGRGFSQLFGMIVLAAAVMGMSIVGLIWGISVAFSSDEIISKERLEPIRIETRYSTRKVTDSLGTDVKRDSLFIYKKP